MPAIKVSIPHKLGADEAKRRISHLISDAKAKFGNMVSDVQENWVQNVGHFRFNAMGFPVSGTLDVQPAVVNVEIQLPFAALPFKGRVENEISTRARELLA